MLQQLSQITLFSKKIELSIASCFSQQHCFCARTVARRSCLADNKNLAPSSSASLLKQPRYCQNYLSASPSSHHYGETTARNANLPVHGVSEMIVGVLGGGQLCRMLCQEASKMGIKVMVLDPNVNCPANALAYRHVVGGFDDGDAVWEFAKRCGVITIEIEHVDIYALEMLEHEGVDCQPKAYTIRIIQDKYLQKMHFSQHGIPVPEFTQIKDIESAERAGNLFGYPLMVKCARSAYDGRGNAVAKSKDDLSSIVSALGGFDRGLYVEKWVPFIKELAVIVARGKDNSILCYPVVETIHKENICHIVKAPADVPWRIKELATNVACKAVSSLKGAGIFAVELFLTSDSQIVLNEVAPRPHNSGHHTIESCYTSQYEQLLRAILGLPLGDPSMKTPHAIMYNLLGDDKGEPGFLSAYQLIGRAFTVQGASIHWYDKSEIWKNRKMGHITIVGTSVVGLESKLNSIMLTERSDSHSDVVPPRVGIIMGSDSDLPVMKDAVRILHMFGVPLEVRIVSAHRTPEMMFSYARSAREQGLQIIIAGAGGAAHLPGMIASLTPLPVIGVPVRAAALEGLDSLLSIVQMPRGVPVATVAINNATNAGLLAVRMLGINDADLLARVIQYQEEARDGILDKAEKLQIDESEEA